MRAQRVGEYIQRRKVLRMSSQDNAHAHDRRHDPNPVPLSQRLLLRPEEVAAILGLGRSTIYELLRAGELSAVHIGRATRIPARDLDRWIEQHSSGSGSGSAHSAHDVSDGPHRAL